MLNLPDWASLKGRGGPWPEGVTVAEVNGTAEQGLGPRVLAALFRDEAVRKLVMETGSKSIRMFNPWRGGWRICVEGLGEYQGETRDDALFNAWVAVLDARDLDNVQHTLATPAG